MQMRVWGYALWGCPGDISATVSEQRHPTPFFKVAATDMSGRALWDDPHRLDNVALFDAGRRQAIPYWWALPGVVDGLARELICDRRDYRYVMGA